MGFARKRTLIPFENCFGFKGGPLTGRPPFDAGFFDSMFGQPRRIPHEAQPRA